MVPESASGIITVEAGAAGEYRVGDGQREDCRTLVDKLPLNLRSFQKKIMLMPGAVMTATAIDDQRQFSANG